MSTIKQFRDNYAWLSNMAECQIAYGKLTFKNVEAFYQAMKTTDQNIRLRFTEYDGPTAKKEGRKLELRNDWEKIKDDVMKYALEKKFANEPFKRLLVNTGDCLIVEGNYWHDNYWGSCYCSKCNSKGLNTLGNLLMLIRSQVK